MKYAWIAAHVTEYPVRVMCRVLKVSTSSYYGWRQGREARAKAAEVTAQLSAKIKALFLSYRSCYGARRIQRALQQDGVTISRRRVSRLMKAEGLVCKVRRRVRATTDSKHTQPIADNLLARDFTAQSPDQKYVGDITYLWTDQGWLYLAVVIDLFSRKVVGWAMADHMQASLVNDALLMALWQRKPKPGLLWHTDRGSQYASASHRQVLADHGIIQSMSRKGNCWDNAVSESFFHTLKVEQVHHLRFTTKEVAKQTLFEYIEVFYNRQRMHSANDYLSPADFEKKMSG